MRQGISRLRESSSSTAAAPHTPHLAPGVPHAPHANGFSSQHPPPLQVSAGDSHSLVQVLVDGGVVCSLGFCDMGSHTHRTPSGFS